MPLLSVEPGHKLQLKEYTDEISSENKYEVKKSNKIMKHDKTETYDMKTKNNRGVLFMVNIINFEYAAEKDRNGAKNDTDAMLYLFKELGFKLFSYTNLTKQQFFVLLEELLKSEHTKNTECFVMALASHGGLENNEQCVVFADGEIAEEREIEAKFAENACNNLKKRPKIFIFPFCRGNMSERGTDSINGNVIERPVLSDLIVCFATSKGYVAYRDDFGTFYIQLFVENMSDNAHDTMFEDIVKKIQTAMKNKCAAEGKAQTPNYENRDFSKALYFNPGYWEGKDESDE
uniref:Caspase family p20 domain-containing protein n=1 Tax=Stomoxys calcitrans TaxID=35570 RepID=A0A1I8P3L8_STOCA